MSIRHVARKSSRSICRVPARLQAPRGLFRSKLIQDAGLRGYKVGGAQVSGKAYRFVVNAGGATAADVRQLIADVQARVKKEFGVELEPEVKMWGF